MKRYDLKQLLETIPHQLTKEMYRLDIRKLISLEMIVLNSYDSIRSFIQFEVKNETQ